MIDYIIIDVGVPIFLNIVIVYQSYCCYLSNFFLGTSPSHCVQNEPNKMENKYSCTYTHMVRPISN